MRSPPTKEVNVSATRGYLADVRNNLCMHVCVVCSRHAKGIVDLGGRGCLCVRQVASISVATLRVFSLSLG